MTSSRGPSASIPKAIGPFKINGVIGSGGMGVVFDATSENGTRIALKVINPKGDSHQRQILTARLLREARLLQQIEHEGIVRLYDSGSVADLVYLAMEFVEGITLDDIRRRGVTPDLGLVLGVGRQLTEAMLTLHKAGVTHRDIKPSNVLIDRSGRVILIDFGIARSEEGTSITSTGEILGSPGYVAPELLEGGRANELTDQFALGKLLFELASSPPKDKIPRGTPVLVRFALRLQADWSRFPEDPSWGPLADVIRRMISIEPSERFPSLEEARQRLVEAERRHFAQLAGAAALPSSLSGPESPRSSTSHGERSGPEGSRTEASKKEALRSKAALGEDSNKARQDETRARLRRFLRELSIQPRSPWRETSTRSRSVHDGGTASESASASASMVVPVRTPPWRVALISTLVFAVFFALGELFFVARPQTDADARSAEVLREVREHLARDDIASAESALKRCIEETASEKCQTQLNAIQTLVSGNY